MRIILALLLSINSFLLAKAHEPHCPKPRTISVAGSATVSQPPDVAKVSFSVISKDKDFKLARELNAKTTAQVLEAVRVLGVPEKDIHMRNFQVNEDWEYNRTTRKNILKGYVATRQFTVDVKKSILKLNEKLSERLAKVVTAVTENGVNRISGVNFALVDSKKLSEQALAEAAKNAKQKALLMLSPLNARLGRVMTVSETNSAPVYFRKYEARTMAVMDEASSPLPQPEAYSEGELTATANVSLVFEIE